MRIAQAILALLVLLCFPAAGQNVDNYTEQGGARTVIGGDLDVVSGGEINIEAGGAMIFVPTDTAPTATEGSIYWDDSENAMKHYNGSSWIAITAGSGDNTLDNAYDQGGAGAGKKIDADTGAVEIEVDDGSNNAALHLDANDSTNDPVVLLIENAADAANAISIDIDAQSTGRDIEGTGATWYVTGAGAATFASLTVPTFYQSAVAAAGSGNVSLTIDAAGNGTITVGGTSTGNTIFPGTVKQNGAVDIGDAATDTLTITAIIDGDVTLDDGAGASPSLILKDATDETVTFSKVDSGYMTITTAAADGVSVRTGNLTVGNGSAGTAAMNGEDAYIEGELEVDGAAQFDGAVTGASTVTVVGTLTASGTLKSDALLDVNEDIDIDLDAADEELNLTTSAVDYGADAAVATIYASGVGQTNAAYLLRLRHAADGDAQDNFFVCEDNDGDDMAKLDSGGVFTVNEVVSPTVQVTTLLNVDEDIDVDFDANDEEINVTTSATDAGADAAVMTVYASGAGQTNAAYLLRLRHATDGDAQDHFIVCEDNDGDDMFKIDSGGVMTVTGSIVPTGGIAGAGTSTIAGMRMVVTNDADGSTITAANIQSVQTNAGAVGGSVLALPEASTCIGGIVTCVTMAAQNFDINPDDADKILGLTDAAGDAIRNATVGNTVTLMAVDATNWVVVSNYGTWTDVD